MNKYQAVIAAMRADYEAELPDADVNFARHLNLNIATCDEITSKLEGVTDLETALAVLDDVENKEKAEEAAGADERDEESEITVCIVARAKFKDL